MSLRTSKQNQIKAHQMVEDLMQSKEVAEGGVPTELLKALTLQNQCIEATQEARIEHQRLKSKRKEEKKRKLKKKIKARKQARKKSR